MANETDIIRELVAKLDEISSRHFLVIHNIGYFEPSKGPCDCALCTARQYLEWREPPAVEDPASDEVEFAKVMP